MSLITLPQNIASGDADNPTRDMANWTTIRDIINGNLDNTNIASAAAIAISKTTLGTFTDWAAWTPTTMVGWTTPIASGRWCQIGKIVYLYIQITGTSNSVTTSFTLPTIPSVAHTIYATGGRYQDNDTFGTGPLMYAITNANTTCTLYINGLGATWTSSGGKIIYASFFYETT